MMAEFRLQRLSGGNCNGDKRTSERSAPKIFFLKTNQSSRRAADYIKR
jgi:hypothetical protein